MIVYGYKYFQLVFTIAPTIKPKGGYFTRPELTGLAFMH